MLSGILGQGLFGDFELGGHGSFAPPVPQVLGSLLAPGCVVSCVVSPLWASVAQQVTITLFQSDSAGNPLDLPGTPTCQIRLPDQSIQTFSLSSTIPITHTALSGVYALVIGGGEAGTYSYTWYVNTQPIWNGLFYVFDRAVP